MPLLDVELFRDKNLRIGTSIKLLYNIVISGTFFVLVLFFQTVLQLNPFDTGLASVFPKCIAVKSIRYWFGFTSVCYGFVYFFIDRSKTSRKTESQDTHGNRMYNIYCWMSDFKLGIITTGETLGSSLGTAIIGIILILGVMGGISTAVDTYAPDYSGDEQFHQEVYDYFQKLDTIEGQDSIVVDTADIIIQNAMASVMYGLAIVLAAMLIITLRIKNKNIKKQ